MFVSGNPGRTQRIFTVAALKYLRDKRMPYTLNLLRRLEILLQQYGYEGEEQQRRARDELFGIQNARKAYTGMLQGLQTPAFMESKRTAGAAVARAAAAATCNFVNMPRHGKRLRMCKSDAPNCWANPRAFHAARIITTLRKR